MTKQTTTKISIDQKSVLAKLIATENISIQHNNVRTASFDVKNRVLTLPIFKTKSPDVYDMLIAHECAHALFTPYKSWAEISKDDELRAYVNVLEDCRIDAKIQKKYPGVVKNYINGFDILNNANFFGVRDKDLNKDLMLIDKINLFYKSSKRLPILFSTMDNIWIKQVNNLKSFKDVVELAKKMLNWQKKEIEKQKENGSLSDSIDKLYKLSDDHKMPEDDFGDSGDSDESSNESEKKDDADEEGDGDSGDVENTKSGEQQRTTPGGDGKDADQVSLGLDSKKFIAITDKKFKENTAKITVADKAFNYVNLPDGDLKSIVVKNKTFINDMRAYIRDERKSYTGTSEYLNWLKGDFKKHIRDNMKTVNYLVKEFEMKKSATAYKRATTDKTGTIDPLRLKDYKFSDDIFKRLTILPTEKNHGMMMLLDWSGSMAADLKKTIDQLLNLVYFCRKINIPFKVYAFTTEYCNKLGIDHRSSDLTEKSTWKYKSGDMHIENFNLIELADHKLKKKQLEESLMYVYNMGLCYSSHVRGFWNDGREEYMGTRFHMPSEYNLGTTPLNEALIACLKMIPLFKNKYNIEKMTFITLTDGGANYTGDRKVVVGEDNKLVAVHKEDCLVEKKIGDRYISVKNVIKIGKKQYVNDEHRSGLTNLLLSIIQKEYNIKTIGFYVLKTIKWWDIGRFTSHIKDYSKRDKLVLEIKSKFTKEKCAQVTNKGYNKYFLLNGKHMAVQNTDLSTIKADDKIRNIKSTFSKSMKGRITSRTLLNKFIEEVA
mgnify:FL=1|tara:strand:- start:981 stop:3299 length:2319 start_codon:yes stop_codon:yes gene_type:complete